MICYMENLTLFLKSAYSKPQIITAALTVEIVDKGPFNAVFKQDSYKADTTWQG